MLNDEHCVQLLTTMRELIDVMNRNAIDSSAVLQPAFQSPASQPCGCHETKSAQQPVSVSGSCSSTDISVALQYGHSAARWNENMAQASIDKTNSFLERQADRWALQFKQLKTATE